MTARVERQKRIALLNPCYLVMETQDPAYQWDEDGWRHILTVDAGYMCHARRSRFPIWHLSVSYQGELHISGDRVRHRLERAMAVLRGTGDADIYQTAEDFHYGQHSEAMHLRRGMTEEERGTLRVRDIRDTPEATTRAKWARDVVPRQDWEEGFIQ